MTGYVHTKQGQRGRQFVIYNKWKNLGMNLLLVNDMKCQQSLYYRIKILFSTLLQHSMNLVFYRYH